MADRLFPCVCLFGEATLGIWHVSIWHIRLSASGSWHYAFCCISAFGHLSVCAFGIFPPTRTFPTDSPIDPFIHSMSTLCSVRSQSSELADRETLAVRAKLAIHRISKLHGTRTANYGNTESEHKRASLLTCKGMHAFVFACLILILR